MNNSNNNKILFWHKKKQYRTQFVCYYNIYTHFFSYLCTPIKTRNKINLIIQNSVTQ